MKFSHAFGQGIIRSPLGYKKFWMSSEPRSSHGNFPWEYALLFKKRFSLFDALQNMFICQAIRKLMYETSFKPKLLSKACFLTIFHIHLNMYGFDKEQHQNLWDKGCKQTTKKRVTACFLTVYHIHLNMYGFDKEQHQNLWDKGCKQITKKRAINQW